VGGLVDGALEPLARRLEFADQAGGEIAALVDPGNEFLVGRDGPGGGVAGAATPAWASAAWLRRLSSADWARRRSASVRW